jgi:hypothetical protein
MKKIKCQGCGGNASFVLKSPDMKKTLNLCCRWKESPVCFYAFTGFIQEESQPKNGDDKHILIRGLFDRKTIKAMEG